MTMLKNVELTETLRAIMSRNTEYYQTDYAEDMQELLHGRQRHYLFMSYRMGTLLVPVYRLSSPDYSRPLRAGELKRIGEGEVFGIRTGDSGDYDRWQRESLEQYARLLQRAQNRQEAR